MKKIKCPSCKSENKRKRGWLKNKYGKAQRYECLSCHKTYTKRNDSLNYRKRKQYLREKISEMYCEGMSLRAIGRVLKIHRTTVYKYFLENSKQAKLNIDKKLKRGKVMTTYVQFDELETFEHTKKKPLGVLASIRVKTGEIISMKVCKTTVKALAVSKDYIQHWNKNIDRSSVLENMLKDTKQALNKRHSTIACDKAKWSVNVANKFFEKDNNVLVFDTSARNKKIDLTFLKMRQDISRLRRRTLATTKLSNRLQKHLDLYTDYHNTKRIA